MHEFLKFFEKLDIYSKASIVSVVVLMPFWYISLFFVSRTFFLDIDITLRIVLAFCFSTLLYFFQVFMLFVDVSVRKKETPPIALFRAASFISVVLLSGLLAGLYHTKLSFESFVYHVFLYVFAFNIVSTLVDFLSDKKRSKKEAQS